MFILIPWKVDVPQEQWPAMNWLIILTLIAVFALQIADLIEHATRQDVRAQDTREPDAPTSQGPTNDPAPQEDRQIPGVTGELILRDWSLKGLFGYMWLHGGLLHLAGNILFLWIFGNAVCAKLGNLRYCALYVLCGVAAGVVHLLFVSGPVLGASGAINGVVGMYLVLFYENEITCLFAWLIPPIVRCFDVSSIWMILFWLLWDIVGVLRGGAGVAYAAHLGGFAAGFGIAMLLCHKGWVTMERYEKSLLQAWRERKGADEPGGLDADYTRLGIPMPIEPQPEPSPARTKEPKPIPLPELKPSNNRRSLSSRASIRTVCACGRDIKVSQQYAGRTVHCPGCGQSVVIPQQTDFFGPAAQEPAGPSPPPAQARDHSIRFACSCGKKIRVPARYAGRSGKCPQCGSRLQIPPAACP